MAVNAATAPYRMFRQHRLGFRISGLVTRIAPGAHKLMLRSFYNTFSRRAADLPVQFLNLGYEPISRAAPWLTLSPEEEPYRYGVQLYHVVASALDLAGKDVLEVGCGRGGGSLFVMRRHRPHSVIGVDFAPSAVAYCRAHHHEVGLSFEQADAESLPFSECTFDVVINVESSHCYPSMKRFLGEVARVLRSGGYLLFADFRNFADLDTLRGQFEDAGLSIVLEEEITEGVARALDLYSDAKTSLIEGKAPKVWQKLLREVSAVKSADTYHYFRSGEFRYFRFVLKKEV
ncbi:MAG: class I SAM-dependent methyltransferase [Isosphaeraceae bacterium]